MDKSSPEKQIGTKIRTLRKRAHLTIGQLADLAELDASFVNSLELGTRWPTLRTLARISKALEISLADLFRNVDLGERDVDQQIALQVRSLLKGRNPADKADILAILKGLRSREDVQALRRLISR